MRPGSGCGAGKADGPRVSDGRTENATPKRRQDLRRKGQVARSAELPQGVVLVLAVALLPATARHLASTLSVDWELALGRAASYGPSSAAALLGTSLLHAFVALAPMVAVVGGGSVVAQLAVTHARPNPSLVRPKFERISPKNGIKRLVSKQVLWELLRNVAKLGTLGLVAYGTWRAGVAGLLASNGTLDTELGATAAVLRSLLARAAALALLIGVADAVVVLRRHRKQVRMTKQEVKDEHRQTEGNPHAKSELRSRAAKLSRSRMIAAVAKADVVLTNPTHLAVALQYEPGTAAPVVVAKGADDVAGRIREQARRHGVPVVENKPLARGLFRAVDVGDHIPVALYQAVAEVLAAIWRTGRR